MIAEEGAGIILYLRQEGRGIGLHDKLRAYNLQDEGYDTVDANLALGHGADERDYTIGALMLHDLGIESVRLLTNNPEKIESLEAHGIDVVDRSPVQPQPNEHNTDYLQTKIERMQHMLELQSPDTVRSTPRSTPRFSSLQKHIDRHSHTAHRPFVTVTLHQRLDGTLVEPKDGGIASFVGPVAARHDLTITGPHHLDALTNALSRHGSKATPVRLLVIDPGLDASIEPYRKPASEVQLTVVTTSGNDTERYTALKDLGIDLVQVGAQDGPDTLVDPIMEWLSRQDAHSVCIHGLPDLTQTLLMQHIADYIVLHVNPQYIVGEASPKLSPIPFSICDPEHTEMGDKYIISGRIKY
jgi:3,4-dihydroxy 2-butanone 4-phosphate synthase/GTP cyclohydrolase II